jgi:hypothetical protein
MPGYREFDIGEVLTASNVNDFLMDQSVMKFADAAARDTALGTAVVSPNALREGMVAYLDDTDTVIAYDGSAWNLVGGGFDDVEVITATDASWPVPSLASPVVKVTVIGGGGAGGFNGGNGANGGTTTFGVGAAFEVVANGGIGGTNARGTEARRDGRLGLTSGNGGLGSADIANNSGQTGSTGTGGEIKISYIDLTGVSTVEVTIGAGGASGGGRGEVIVEYKAA